jgi:hypothetical protein
MAIHHHSRRIVWTIAVFANKTQPKGKRGVTDMQNAVFHIGLAALFTHELDAIQQREWRLLYMLRSLSDEAGALWFVAVHVPLFAAITLLCFHGDTALRRWSQRLLSLFFIIHAGLHWRLMGDPLAPFDSPLSLVLIHGCALCGLFWLTLEARTVSSKKTTQ